MNQQELDFNRDVNEQTYTLEESLKINEIVSAYQAKKNVLKDEIIIIQLFFEDYCIEISKRLKLAGFFKGDWKFEENSFGLYFYDFLQNKIIFNDTTLTEFIILLFGHLNCGVKAINFQKNSESDFAFDRKTTEDILNNIVNGDNKTASFIFLAYMKIWNFYKIYKQPFNNNKALLIHRIFSENIWPKNLISYEAYNKFELSVKQIINEASVKYLYIPFFDNQEYDYYSNNYLKEKNKLKQNIENLFDYDLTDESEPYSSLIEDILNNPSENAYKKELIFSKVERKMLPTPNDIEMFTRLYETAIHREFGKKLLSKFYLFNILNFEN